MTLQQYLRSCSNNHIRPLHIKEECEVCGNKDSLELHHVVPFSQLLEECMESLGLDIRDKKEHYTSKEVINITNWMLGAELKTASVTLCKCCHIEEHNKSGGFVGVNDGFQRWVEEERARKEILKQKRIKEKVEPYLKSILGERLFRQEQKDLILVLSNSGLTSRTYGLTTINRLMTENNLPFKLVKGKRRKFKEKDGVWRPEKSHWLLCNV